MSYNIIAISMELLSNSYILSVYSNIIILNPVTVLHYRLCKGSAFRTKVEFHCCAAAAGMHDLLNSI